MKCDGLAYWAETKLKDLEAQTNGTLEAFCTDLLWNIDKELK